MKNEQERRGIVAAAISWTKTTAITPSLYEKNLLQQYIEGVLTIDRVIELLEENSENSMKRR
ncbi:hypothetical protein [Hymenobacter bucti]|uniref:Antitoxin VbhA domain-containing protein n=1 Tax=Hymenobacter bucti TaxID=1844114 RepID=A0ABW4R1F0_9BACT